MNIAQTIRTILDKEGRIVIPGLGILENSYNPASLSEDKKTLSPPETKTSFTQDLKIEDDTLSQYLAETENIPINESKEAVENYVQKLRHNLQRSRKVYVDKLGHFIIRNRHLHFIPEASNELPELTVDPLIGKAGEKEATPPVIPAKEVKPEKKPKVTKAVPEKKIPAFVSYLAIPLILLLVILAILIYIQINPSNAPYFKAQFSGHIPFRTYPDQVITIPMEKPVKKDVVVAAKPPEPPKQVIEEKAIPTPRTGDYHIIVASLEYKTMAEVFASKLTRQGYKDAMIIGPASNGNYRVSLEHFSDKSLAMLHLMYARNLIHPKAWLLKY